MDSEIKQQFDGLRAETRALAQETAGLQSAFDGLRAETRALAQETAGLQSAFDGLREETRALAHETAGLQSALARETAGLQSALARETVGLRTEIRSVADRGEEIKRSLGVLSESLRTDIRTVAEGFILTNERLDRFESRVYEEFRELKAMMRLSFADLDRRLQSR